MRTLPVLQDQIQLYSELGLNPTIPNFDNSFLSCMTNCQRLAYWQYILGRQSKKSRFSLDYGSGWHEMQEILASTGDVGAALASADKYVPEDIDDRYGRCRSKIKDTFLWHQEHHRDAYARMELIRQEQSFMVNCPKGEPCVFSENGCDHTHGGRIDRIYRFMKKVWLLDFKTSTRKDDDMTMKLSLDSQMLGYSWAASHLLGEVVWGVIIDKTISNKSTTESKHHPIAISRDLIMDWVEDAKNTQRMIQQKFVDGAYDHTKWIKNHDYCFRWGQCGFHDVCTVSDEISRLKYLAFNYPEKRWDFMRGKED